MIYKKFVLLLCIVCFVFYNRCEVSASTYKSELTGLPIDVSVKDLKPVAVMIDNEQKALPHASVSKADIVYEMMNSTANDRITRLMCFYKNYKDLDKIGSVRSVRPSHIPLASEYHAILIHEGGPEIYVKTPLSQSWSEDLNGGFSRLQNGKATEFTEFVLQGEVELHAKKAGISLKYQSDYNNRSHFIFGDNKLPKGSVCKKIDMSVAYPHTKSQLVYNDDTSSYDYYCYGFLQKDWETDVVTSFTNVIVQITPFFQLDENGYMAYSIIGRGEGYYCYGGKVIPVYWKKESAIERTKYFDKATGKELVVNPGNTYINVYPKEYASGLVIK